MLCCEGTKPRVLRGVQSGVSHLTAGFLMKEMALLLFCFCFFFVLINYRPACGCVNCIRVLEKWILLPWNLISACLLVCLGFQNGNITELLLKEGFARCVDWSIAVYTRGAEKLRAAER